MTQHKWTISITVQPRVSFRGQTWKPSMDRLSCWGGCLPTNWNNSWIIIIPYDVSRKVLTKRTILSIDQIWLISKSSSTYSLSPVLNNEYFSTVSESPSIKHSLLSQDASSDSRCKTQWKKKWLNECVFFSPPLYQLSYRRVRAECVFLSWTVIVDNFWFSKDGSFKEFKLNLRMEV